MEMVSIVVPVYNMGSKIQDCVKYILQQTYECIEVILVDDGSKDDSYEKCLEIAQKDPRVSVIHTDNQGSGPARNEGIRVASGRYIYFPDADDYIERNAIETLVANIIDSNSDLVVFGYKNIDINQKLISTKTYKSKIVEAEEARKDYSSFLSMYGEYTVQGAPWNKLFDLEVIKKFNIKYPALRRHQDQGFIARYMNVAARLCFIPDVLYTYYVNDLKKEWDKYPVDYIEAVKGLFEERKNNILIWNQEDTLTHELVYQEYICGIIKALELSFSPKFNFSKKDRVNWIKENIRTSKLMSIPVPTSLGGYQRTVLKLIEMKKVNLLYYCFFIKISLEKNGIIQALK